MTKEKSQKVLREELRGQYLQKVVELFSANGEEVLRTGSNEIALPCVNGAGDDEFVVITVKVPTGSRDGEAYDGYAMAQEFQMKNAEKAEKAKASAERKAKKIARDQKMREDRAKAKAERAAKN